MLTFATIFVSEYTVKKIKCTKYEGRSEINASSFIMLAHDIRGGCW